jgi:hypothetical protein
VQRIYAACEPDAPLHHDAIVKTTTTSFGLGKNGERAGELLDRLKGCVSWDSRWPQVRSAVPMARSASRLSPVRRAGRLGLVNKSSMSIIGEMSLGAPGVPRRSRPTAWLCSP